MLEKIKVFMFAGSWGPSVWTCNSKWKENMMPSFDIYKKTKNIGLIFFKKCSKKLREHNSQVTNRYNRTICNLFINSLYTTKYNRASSFLNIALHINRRYWTTLLTRSIPQFIKTVKSVSWLHVCCISLRIN